MKLGEGKVWLKKKVKVVLSVIVAVLVCGFVVLGLYWNGAFNRFLPTDVAKLESPDGKYVLIYQQMGDPEWPFGSTDVRLVLKDRDGRKIASVNTFIADDGSAASEMNIKSVEWKEKAVVVVLQASEMDDREIVLEY